jgi:hypothetical protein
MLRPSVPRGNFAPREEEIISDKLIRSKVPLRLVTGGHAKSPAGAGPVAELRVVRCSRVAAEVAVIGHRADSLAAAEAATLGGTLGLGSLGIAWVENCPTFRQPIEVTEFPQSGRDRQPKHGIRRGLRAGLPEIPTDKIGRTS